MTSSPRPPGASPGLRLWPTQPSRDTREMPGRLGGPCAVCCVLDTGWQYSRRPGTAETCGQSLRWPCGTPVGPCPTLSTYFPIWKVGSLLPGKLEFPSMPSPTWPRGAKALACLRAGRQATCAGQGRGWEGPGGACTTGCPHGEGLVLGKGPSPPAWGEKQVAAPCPVPAPLGSRSAAGSRQVAESWTGPASPVVPD